MKKLKKNQLKLDKEIISSLSENELSFVKGGEGGPLVSGVQGGWGTCECPKTFACVSVAVTGCETQQNTCGFVRVTENCPAKDSKGYTCDTYQSICFVCLPKD